MSRILFADAFRHWKSGKGLALLLLAILVPPALTAAWVFTHQNDVAVTDITWSPDDPELGDNVTFTVAVQNAHDRDADAFNVTLRVGHHEEVFGRLSFRDRFNETQRIPGLAAGASTTVSFTWNSSSAATGVERAGSYIVEAFVDLEDELQEIEERNNHWQAQLTLATPPTGNATQPEIPPPAADNSTQASMEVTVDGIALDPAPVAGVRTNVTVTVTNHGPDDLHNGTLAVQVLRESASYRVVDGFLVPERSQLLRELLDTRSVNLSAGQTEQYRFQVPSDLRVAPYVAETRIFTGADEPDFDNNAALIEFQVDRQITFVPPAEKADAKAFYRDVLAVLHLRYLIPLIALLFAAGTLEDERQRGNLPYLLTRPVPRWALPVSRFAVGSIVAGAGILLGVILTFLLLLGAPQDAPGFFTFPLLFSWLALVVYGALFTLLGVLARRPYLLGLVYVLGIEEAIRFGREFDVGGEPLLQSQVEWFSLRHWMLKAFDGWQAGTWDGSSGAGQALVVLLAVAAAALVYAASYMRTAEIET